MGGGIGSGEGSFYYQPQLDAPPNIADFVEASPEERERLKEEASQLFAESLHQVKDYKEALQKLEGILEKANQRLRERASRFEAMCNFQTKEREK